MSGETDLQLLLNTMKPKLLDPEYVFVTKEVGSYGQYAGLCPIGFFQEKEGMTLIIPKILADESHLAYQAVFKCISLEVHSSLEAVGLTVAFAAALAKQGISANVVAGFYHDHIFVTSDLADSAVEALQQLSQGEDQ